MLGLIPEPAVPELDLLRATRSEATMLSELDEGASESEGDSIDLLVADSSAISFARRGL